MEKLFEIQALLLKQLGQQVLYQRAVYQTFSFDNRLNCIYGARGVGKTTFLLQYVAKNGAETHQSLYISADNVYFLTEKLIDLVDTLYKETDVRLLCIDEIHKHNNWQQQLKNITDTYLDFKVIFTGSSQVDLIHSQYDLSRRVTQYHLCRLSFREYLAINHQQEFSVLKLETIIKKHSQMCAFSNLAQPN